VDGRPVRRAACAARWGEDGADDAGLAQDLLVERDLLITAMLDFRERGYAGEFEHGPQPGTSAEVVTARARWPRCSPPR
jgi:hypothetical protein